MKQEIKLNRTDNRPIAFMGEEIVSDTTRDQRDSRWYTGRIFITDDGYMVGLAHITCWPKERDQYWAEEAKTKRQVIKILEDHIPEAKTEEEIEIRGEYIAMIDRIGELIKSDGQIKTKASSA